MDLLAWAHSPDGNRAVTFLLVRDSGYWLESLYVRCETGWSEVTTSNGTLSYSHGVIRLYGHAPEQAAAALVSWQDTIHETPVHNGHFAFAAWDLDDEEFLDSDEPHLVGFIDAGGRRLGEHL